MEVFSLDEGIFGVDRQKNLTMLTELDQGAENQYLRMAVRPFLIRMKNELLLLDCGLELQSQDHLGILSLLKQYGVEAGQITKILVSHLHKDHIEGMGYFRNRSFIQHFPSADIYVCSQELDYALSQKGNPSFNDDLVQQVAKLPNLKLIDTKQGNITPEIYFEVTGGHTPYHLAFWITQGDQTFFYGGDNLPQAHYLDYPIAYKTDYDGKKAMALRQYWQNEAKKNHWTILLYHDLKLAMLNF